MVRGGVRTRVRVAVLVIAAALIVPTLPAVADGEGPTVIARSFTPIPPGLAFAVEPRDDSDTNLLLRDLIVGELAANAHLTADNGPLRLRFSTDRVVVTTLGRGYADARYAGSGAGQQEYPDDLSTMMSEDPERGASPRERREGAVQFRLRASVETRDGAVLWRGGVIVPLTLTDERRLGRLLAVTLVAGIGRTIDH
jgi:hypothetical protein